MDSCCYKNFNNSTNECNSTIVFSHCVLPFFLFLCIPFLLLVIIFNKSRNLNSRNRRRKRINPSVYALKKGEPDIISRTCCICQEEILFKNLITLQCHHYFHQSCLQKWFRYKTVCPICRHDFRVI